ASGRVSWQLSSLNSTSQTQDTTQDSAGRFGTAGGGLGRLWDGFGTAVKCKKPSVCRPWDGGTAYTGGIWVCPLMLSALDTKVPSFWTPATPHVHEDLGKLKQTQVSITKMAKIRSTRLRRIGHLRTPTDTYGQKKTIQS